MKRAIVGWNIASRLGIICATDGEAHPDANRPREILAGSTPTFLPDTMYRALLPNRDVSTTEESEHDPITSPSSQPDSMVRVMMPQGAIPVEVMDGAVQGVRPRGIWLEPRRIPPSPRLADRRPTLALWDSERARPERPPRLGTELSTLQAREQALLSDLQIDQVAVPLPIERLEVDYSIRSSGGAHDEHEIGSARTSGRLWRSGYHADDDVRTPRDISPLNYIEEPIPSEALTDSTRLSQRQFARVGPNQPLGEDPPRPPTSLLHEIMALMGVAVPPGTEAAYAVSSGLADLCENNRILITEQLIDIAQRVAFSTGSLERVCATQAAGLRLPLYCPTLFAASSRAKLAALMQRALCHRDNRAVGVLPIVVKADRTSVIFSTMRTLLAAAPVRIIYAGFQVQFTDEAGLDSSGVTRDFFAEFAKSLTTRSEGGWLKMRPDGLFDIDEEWPVSVTSGYKVIGRMMAASLIREIPLGIRFPLHFYVGFLGQLLDLDHLAIDEPDLHNSLSKVMEMDAATLEAANLELDLPIGPVTVTMENRAQLVYLKVQQLLTSPRYWLIQQGFAEIFKPEHLANLWTPGELREYIAGEAEVDVADWKSVFSYETYGRYSPQVKWFWEVVEEMTHAQRRSLLRFISSYNNVPPGGFRKMAVDFVLGRINVPESHLPSSHTCTLTLDLPPYSNKALLKEKLMQAIEADPAMGIA